MAPLIVSITVPERNIRNVGILCEKGMSAGLIVSLGMRETVRGHAILPGDILLAVNIDLGKSDPVRLGVLCRQRLVGWSNSLARATPICIDCSILVKVFPRMWAGTRAERRSYNQQSRQ